MKKLSDKVIIATGIEMHKAGLFIENTGDEIILWVKYNWSPNEPSHFAPFTGVTEDRKEDSTHTINNEFYLKFDRSDSGGYSFVGFLNRFIEVKELNHAIPTQ